MKIIVYLENTPPRSAPPFGGSEAGEVACYLNQHKCIRKAQVFSGMNIGVKGV